VIRTDPAPYDRFRIGCEITELDEEARVVIGELSAVPETGSEAERRPEVHEARERLRGQTGGLAPRIRP